MNSSEVLKIVLREMCAYGSGWRSNWGDFDGRTLRNQLNGIANWAAGALESNEVSDYNAGTLFCEEQLK